MAKKMPRKYARLRNRVIAAQTLASAPSYARHGNLEVRLAQDVKDVKASQRLRYTVFYEEWAAQADWRMKRTRRDMDPYDGICDHLLVIDHAAPRRDAVVGTYRLLRQDVADRFAGFYSSQEYDLSPLTRPEFRAQMGHDKQLLELGRSCVHPDYRTSHTINLLWKGIASYLEEHRIAYMFGCASFPGANPHAHARAMSYLYHEHLCPDDFMVRALPDQYRPMEMCKPGDYEIRQARRELPPLVKGYLRLGCFIGDGAVVDHQFNTTDVFILLPVERVAKRYSTKFGAPQAANTGTEDRTAAEG
ncbi:GNAT family N-acetyltransferase [Rhodothalassium salexigens]|uniref:GNAT family N-acetyltransferase n=1 Tax=Rhodothalassium salexigens TaxID=1086 RepID=UPI001911F920|nr:GNAT family N-acyltransferase [Rhodothalassium salexigens]